VTIEELGKEQPPLHRHRVSIAGTDNSACSRKGFYLKLDRSLAPILTPGLRVGQVVVILGGILDSDTLRLSGVWRENQLVYNPAHILHFVPDVSYSFHI